MTITLAPLQIVELTLLMLTVDVISMITVILIASVLSHHWFKRRLHQMYHEIQTDTDQGQAGGYGGSVNLLSDNPFDEIVSDLDLVAEQMSYDTPGFSTTGMVPGSVGYVGRTEVQFSAAARQFKSKRKSRWFRRGQNAVSSR